MELFVGLTKFAHEATIAEVDDLIRRALLDPRLGFVEMLETINRKGLQKHFAARCRPFTRVPGLEPPWHSASHERLIEIGAQSDTGYVHVQCSDNKKDEPVAADEGVTVGSTDSMEEETEW